jgi:protein TonB
MMNSATAPAATSFSLSILLHGAALAVLLPFYEPLATTGHGLEIELVSSTLVSQQQETDEPRKQQAPTLLENISASQRAVNEQQEQKQRLSSPAVVTSRHSAVSLPDDDVENDPGHNDRLLRWQETDRVKQQLAGEGNSSALLRQSTNAVEQQHSLLELLHDSISNNKEYPYIARRQRREGVATVGFVLHPDGSVEGAHLVTSSHTTVLDHAALSAVKRIEPFKPAQDYLDHAEAFSIDVVFNLL